jgi:hypothetical protein
MLDVLGTTFVLEMKDKEIKLTGHANSCHYTWDGDAFELYADLKL